MKYKIIDFLLSVIIGSIANPGVLASADIFDILQPDFHAVETVEMQIETDVASENTDISFDEPAANTSSASVAPAVAPVAPDPAPVPTPTPVAPAPKPVYIEPANNIKIAGKTLEIIDTPSVQQSGLDYVHAYRYNGKFLYGHNSASVFGGLKNLGVGATFSVTTNGATRNYRVANVVVFEKNVEKSRLELNGSGSYMSLVAKAKHAGVQYDLSIMTCHGTSFGNGDASHRLVIFANAI